MEVFKKKKIFFYRNALHEACYKGKIEIINFLINLPNIDLLDRTPKGFFNFIYT